MEAPFLLEIIGSTAGSGIDLPRIITVIKSGFGIEHFRSNGSAEANDFKVGILRGPCDRL